MEITSACIVGGSGFVGRSVAEQLCARGMRVRVITRNRTRAMPIAVLPTAEIEVANPHDPVALARAFENMDAVVNLVGILHEGGGRTFQQCHVELPRKVARACVTAGVQHELLALAGALRPPDRIRGRNLRSQPAHRADP